MKITVRDTQGRKYDLLESAMIERRNTMLGAEGRHLVLRHDLNKAIPVSSRATQGAVRLFSGANYFGRYAVRFVNRGKRKCLAIGCRHFGLGEAAKIARWARD